MTDPTGHRECNDPPDCESGGSYTPSPLPKNPWQLVDREKNGHANMSAEEILFESFVMPTDSAFNSFGGPMTSLNCDRPTRPSCDARHPAADGYGKTGDPIYAAAYGHVVLIGYPQEALDGNDPSAGGFGKYIVVEHDIYGTLLFSIYAHNGTIMVNIGDIVGSGEQIATMGSSGTSDVHLHFEIRHGDNIDWEAVNPFRSQVYWPQTVAELTVKFVDLGPMFGYDST